MWATSRIFPQRLHDMDTPAIARTQPGLRREYFVILSAVSMILATAGSWILGPLIPGALLGICVFVLLTWAAFLRPDLVFLGAFALSIVLPVEVGFKWDPLPRIGPSIVVFAALILGASANLLVSRGSDSVNALLAGIPMKRLWVFIIALNLVSTVASIDRLASFYAMGKQTMMILILAALMNLFARDPAFWPRLRTVLFFATALTCIYALFEEVARQNMLLAFYPTEVMDFRSGILRVRSTFFHPIAFGTYLAMVYPFILVDVLQRKRPAVVVVLLLTLLASFLTVSRGPWLALLIETAVIASMFFKRELRLAAAALFTLLALLCLANKNIGVPESIERSSLLNPSQQSLEHLDESSSEFYRIAVMTAAVDRMAGMRWLYGFGPGTFYLADVSSRYSGEDHVLTSGDSQYALTLVELGAAGLCILVLVIANAVRIGLRAVLCTKGFQRLLAAACLASILGLAINCITASMFLLVPLDLIFWSVVVLASNLRGEETRGGTHAAIAHY